jgi:hypothetical protein
LKQRVRTKISEKLERHKNSYQQRTNLLKDENDDLLVDSHNVLNLYNVHDIKQTEMHTAEPLVSEPSYFEVEIALEKLKGINCQSLIKF